MIETTFGAGAAGCYPKSMASCVRYDISLILSNTGGAAYNLPVQLSCPNQATYTCTGNTPNCINAQFHPMFVPPWSKYQPNAQCPAGSALRVTFHAAPQRRLGTCLTCSGFDSPGADGVCIGHRLPCGESPSAARMHLECRSPP